jgi:hypothetical protein
MQTIHPSIVMILLALCSVALIAGEAGTPAPSGASRPWVQMRGIYGGFPTELTKDGERLEAHGINAVFVGSKGINDALVAAAREQGVRLFAEFNTMHMAAYLKEHPDAAPVGSDGQVSPPPEGWQGVCPTHEGYRRSRMEEFQKLLQQYPVAGVWLDYHHSHASWERADPVLPDTCFCDRCLQRFSKETGISLPQRPRPEVAQLLLGEHRARWVQWRCDVFTDWVREFRKILDATRPGALLGSFHCPWSEGDLNGALREKLAIDLKAQAAYLDVFSPMPYHARFGHVKDPDWISRQVAWLGQHLGIEGKPDERLKIWPIVQVADWGEPVPWEQVETVLDHGSRRPATGVMVFNWGGLRKSAEKVKAISAYYCRIR